MTKEMTKEKAINYINDLRMYSSCQGWDDEYKEACDLAIKALEKEPCETIKDIPKDYKYDTETKDFLVYRHMYTGHEIHIEKPVPRYRLEQTSILDKIRAEIEKEYLAEGHLSDYWDGIDKCLQIIDKYKAE